MKKTILLFFVNISIFAIAQTTSTSKWNVSLVNSVDAAYRFTKASPDLAWLKENMDAQETWKATFSSGLQTAIKLHSKLDLVIGCNYSNKGQQLRPNALLKMNYYRTSYRMMEAPIFINYALPLNKGSFKIGIGPELLFLFNTISRFQTIGSNTTQTIKVNETNEKKLFFGSIAQVAYERPLDSHVHIQFAVNYKQQWTQFSTGGVQRNLFNFGMQLGLVYRH